MELDTQPKLILCRFGMRLELMTWTLVHEGDDDLDEIQQNTGGSDYSPSENIQASLADNQTSQEST
jgi:hypothetical protein